MILRPSPADFNPMFEVVSCICEYDGKILLLHRNGDKPEGGKWGIPAGKINANEHALDAIVREIKEETGIQCSRQYIAFYDMFYVRHPHADFRYITFYTKLFGQVNKNKGEHQDYCWKTPEEALEMNLVTDEDFCLRRFYRYVLK